MTRVLSATVMEAQTTRTRRRLSSQRNPWLKDGEADGPIKRSSSTGFIRSLLSGVCGDQLCFSMMGHLKRDFEQSHHARVQWFGSFPMIPGDQPTCILENQHISRLQPYSFASGRDPTLLIRSPAQKQGRQSRFFSASLERDHPPTHPRTVASVPV